MQVLFGIVRPGSFFENKYGSMAGYSSFLVGNIVMRNPNPNYSESTELDVTKIKTRRHGWGHLPLFSVITALTTVLICVNLCRARPNAAKKRWVPQTGFGNYESDSSGKAKSFNYGLDIEPIGNSGFFLHDLAGQNLVVFYFSASCHHCRSAAPYIKKLSDTLSTYGFIFVGIAVSRNKKSKILSFAQDQKLDIILFKDYKRDFSELYGMSSLPVVMLVGKNGNYMRGEGNNIGFVYEQVKKAVFEKHLFP